MSNDRPSINPLASYGVVKASALLGIDRKTLRRYEVLGYITSRVNRMGARRYTGTALLKLWQLFY